MEIEIKLLLEPGEAERLCARLGPPVRVVQQHNFYFDDEARRLGRSGWGLRLRRESSADGDAAWLTLKSTGEEYDGFVHRPEYELALTPAELDRLRADPVALVRVARDLLPDPAALPEVEPVEIARLVNRRQVHVLPGPGGLEAELDHTVWPDGSESDELELEIDDAARAQAARERLVALFEEAGVGWRPGRVSKLARLLRMLEAS